jgi:spermidine synthase
LLHPDPRRIAMIGLGGGSLLKFCHRHLPASVLSVVEINARVIGLREAFAVPPDGARLQVLHGDGAAFVHGAPDRFDVLLVDGYDARGLPARLSSQRFYDGCRRTLSEQGVLVVNLHQEHPVFDRVVQRIRRSFAAELLVVGDQAQRNSVVFATRAPMRQCMRPEPLRRPRAVAPGGWATLQDAFAGVCAAHRERGA